MRASTPEMSPRIKSPAPPTPHRPQTPRSLLPLLLASLLLATPAFAADPASPSDFDGPPIEHDTLKKDPDARFLKMFNNDGSDSKDAIDILNHIDDYRKTFWATYPDKKYHEEAREAFAQALFLKDIHYLQGVLYLHQLGGAMAPAFSPYPGSPPDKDISHDDIMAGGLAAVQFDGVGAIDDGIPQSATPEYSDWYQAMRQALGPVDRHSNSDAAIKAGFQVGFGIVGGAYRKACNFGGKEYQAYLMARDWAEFDKENKIPDGYDNPQKYGIYLYARQAELPLDQAKATYADMVSLLGISNVQSAADFIRKAPKSPQQLLFSKYPPPTKRSPSGEQIPDYDVPMPQDITGFFTNQLVEMEALATQSASLDAKGNPNPHAYLLFLFKSRYFTNQQHNYLDPKATKWSFAETTYKALCNAFGTKPVLDLAEKIRTAPKRQVGMTIIDPTSLGATRNDPIEAFEDILARSDPKGYVKAALAFNQNINDPGSVDVNAAYQKLLATTDEKALLETAKLCAAGGRLASANPRFAFRDELLKIKQKLVSPDPVAAPPTLIDDPDFLAWKKFPATVKVSYVIRGWTPDKPGSTHLIPGNPSIRYTMSVLTLTPEQILLNDAEIVYDYPSGIAHPPHDTQIGYAAKRALPTPAQDARIKGAQNTTRTPAPAITPATDAGDETLTLAGRSIPTHWTSTTRVSGNETLITKIWSSDQIPGALVRKTEETTRSPAVNVTGLHQFRETVLESFQGFTPGTPALPGAAAPDAPPAPTPASLAALPPPVAPLPPARTPATPPTTRITPPTTPPARTNTPAPAATPPALDPVAQKQVQQRYTAVRNRYFEDLALLSPRGQRGQTLPANIAEAQSQANLESTAAATAMRARNYDEANQQLQSAEDNLTVIENYLKP